MIQLSVQPISKSSKDTGEESDKYLWSKNSK